MIQPSLAALYAEPAFQSDFGIHAPGGGYQIAARWQTALSMAGDVGIIIGAFLNGYLWEKAGNKRTMLISYVAITALTFLSGLCRIVTSHSCWSISLWYPMGHLRYHGSYLCFGSLSGCPPWLPHDVNQHHLDHWAADLGRHPTWGGIYGQ